ncbi:MAG: hypothetical protein PHC88_17040 [Terrimicrobiaceae bacterium]|nr:hypothetical protein [Terrimicrobiaceae bacterium]
MKTADRFLALLRFHALGVAWLWIYPAVLVFYALIGSIGRNFDLTLRLSMTSDLGSWMFLMFLASFLFGGNPSFGARAKSQRTILPDPEFLLTRAVSRPDVYWARMALYWLMVFIPVLVLLGWAIWTPSRTFHGTSATLAEFSKNLPNGHVERAVKGDVWLSVPQGTMLVAGWRVGLLLFTALLSQVVVCAAALLPGRWRWISFAGFVGIGVAINVSTTAPNFFFAVSHAAELVALFVLLTAGSAWLCRWIFLRQEF